MPKPTLDELNESIELLSAYSNRLQKEVLRIAQKLKMPQKKIDKMLQENEELKRVSLLIEKLSKERDQLAITNT